ncbi:Protein UPSTREAM OF FLC [Forsythia ovata]|uniref:Protein UPSTREAM OF FLC n=1 Tax=Forsythia ovata TaxID=205694 RepID=A0ABD1U9B2_9LAMI
MEVSVRKCKKLSPERARVCVQPRMTRPKFKKVQVIYYLSRNGQLEHPHYMEVTHLAHQQLRLKDVMDRLTGLRGKGMPSLYSWSCKRSYKNGYVWNDLSENDIIYPSQGAEYVLKGSELIEGCTEKLQHLQVGNVQQFQPVHDLNFQPKRKSFALKRHPEPEDINVEDEEEEEEYEEKTSYTNSNTPHSKCSRGVSTDEIYELQQETQKTVTTELKIGRNSFSSPQLTNEENNDTSKRFEDGDPVANEPLLSRNSMLFSLIACGGSTSFRKTAPSPIAKLQPVENVVARKSGCGDSLHKGVVCKAAKVAVEDGEMIGCMSENPRFGNLQSEEKDYFSGSIVESMITHERFEGEPRFKKSSSFNEERCKKVVFQGEEAVKEVKKESYVKGKCIPRKKPSSKHSKKSVSSVSALASRGKHNVK